MECVVVMQLPRPGSSIHCAKPGSAGQSAVTFAAAAFRAEARGAAVQTRCRLACLTNPRRICWRPAADTKYDSGTGWPSFWKPLDPEHVIEVADNSIPFMVSLLVPVVRMGHQRQWLAAMPTSGWLGLHNSQGRAAADGHLPPPSHVPFCQEQSCDHVHPPLLPACCSLGWRCCAPGAARTWGTCSRVGGVQRNG